MYCRAWNIATRNSISNYHPPLRGLNVGFVVEDTCKHRKVAWFDYTTVVHQHKYLLSRLFCICEMHINSLLSLSCGLAKALHNNFIFLWSTNVSTQDWRLFRFLLVYLLSYYEKLRLFTVFDQLTYNYIVTVYCKIAHIVYVSFRWSFTDLLSLQQYYTAVCTICENLMKNFVTAAYDQLTIPFDLLKLKFSFSNSWSWFILILLLFTTNFVRT